MSGADNKMIVNRAMIDYCTMTSFNPAWIEEIKRDYSGIGKTSSARFLQYEGEVVNTEHGSIVMGEGLNRSPGLAGAFQHFVCKWSGEMAEGSPNYWWENECNVKRIDIQVTVKTDLKDIPGEMEIKLRSGHKFNNGKGRAPIPHLHRSSSSTLYYGSRTGDSFWRLYEKQAESGEWYLRWEFELKRGKAEWAMGLIQSGVSVGDIFRTLVGDYHESYEWYVAPFLAAARGEAVSGYVREKNRDTISWLETLTPTVERLLRNHQTRYRTVALLKDWYDMAVQLSLSE